MAKEPSMLGVPHRHIKLTILWYVVFLVAGVIAIYALQWWHHRAGSKSVAEQAAQGPIKDYSLNGDVTSIDASGGSFVVKTGWLESTSTGNQFVYYNRTVKLAADGQVVSVSKAGTGPVLNKNPLDYLRVGDKVTISGDGSPYQSDTLTATKVEVQR